ncbi:MAG: hypothetical protein ACREXR_16115 [Gammaproteobacteria bacterium]
MCVLNSTTGEHAVNEHAEKPSLSIVALVVGGVVYALWLIRIADDRFALERYRWGVYPRALSGLQASCWGPWSMAPLYICFSKPKHLAYVRSTWG